MVIETGVDIINFDAYFYTESILEYSKKITDFLKNGGFLALGIVPTFDIEALSSLNKDSLYKKFNDSVNLLSKNIDKNLILKQCFITPSCGCSSLSLDLTQKVFELTKELSLTLKKEIKVNI